MQQSDADKVLILGRIPADAVKVRVVNKQGREVWRKRSEILPTDTISLKGDNITPIVMKSKPGRPSGTAYLNKRKPPPNPNLEKFKAEEKAAEKAEAICTDPLLAVARLNPEGTGVLDQVMLGLAEEAASMGFERRRLEDDGAESAAIARLSQYRVSALKAIGDTYLKRRDHLNAQGKLDMDSAAFQKVFKFILETFRETMNDSGLRAEAVETVFANLSGRLNAEWQAEARRRIQDGK